MDALANPAKTTAQRVVIIDDTADLRDLLRIAMARGGFDVVGEAGDGSAGIDVVRRLRPDIVLLDLAMPVMDGIEALPTIRRLCPQAKIVVLSGFGAQQMSARAVAAGADGYVQKGAPLTTILDYVRDIAAPGAAPGRSLSVVPAVAPPALTAAVAPDDRSTDVDPDRPQHPDDAPGGRHAGPTHPPAPAAPSVPPFRAPHADKLEKEPAMSVVGSPPTSLPSRPGPGAPAPAGADASAWQALAMAPYGVVELADEPLFRIKHLNPVAARLLGTEKPGTPLAMVAAELASLVSYHRLDADASFETDLDGGRVRATLRRTGWSVIVYLDSTAEDVGLLRRAIATTAHEVRGPVAVLCGIAETLTWDGDLISPEQSRRLMESVARQARILDRITADLLTAAQIQRGTLRIDLQVVDPRQVVQGSIEGRWDVEVSVSDARPVRADPLRLEQMLTNLLSNAHKYGEAPFSVHIRPDGQHVCIDVVDSGDGVPREFAEHLFSEYARAHGAVATGNGLGLYVVRTLARAQNGEVSYAPGREGGAVFTIRLLAA